MPWIMTYSHRTIALCSSAGSTKLIDGESHLHNWREAIPTQIVGWILCLLNNWMEMISLQRHNQFVPSTKFVLYLHVTSREEWIIYICTHTTVLINHRMAHPNRKQQLAQLLIVKPTSRLYFPNMNMVHRSWRKALRHYWSSSKGISMVV